MDSSSFWREYRCKQCGKLLFKGILVESEIEVKCRGCHEISVFKGENASELLCMIPDCPRRIRPIPASAQKSE
ncbi:MAG: hypothetical protein Q8Q39_00085 [bacterium]|nr:hypothetical protein [bacterium]